MCYNKYVKRISHRKPGAKRIREKGEGEGRQTSKDGNYSLRVLQTRGQD